MLKQQKYNTLFKKFLRKNLLRYIFPNIIFNSCIPYLTLRSMYTVYLFHGKYCFARFLLPMALLLPFIITYDILKRTIVFSQRVDTMLELPDHFTKNKFMFTMATINGVATLIVFLIIMLCVQINIPDHYGFNGTILSVLLGIIAGILSIIFALLPIKKIIL
jgi:hypothetical protein